MICPWHLGKKQLGKGASMGMLLLTVFGFFVSIAQASSCESQAFELAPAFVFANETAYRPLACSDNIFAFVQNLKEGGVDISQAQVVLIRHKAAAYLPIRPLQSRLKYQDKTYKPSLWSFHVFLVFKGMVFDFDYTDDLQAIGINKYMNTMWDSSLMGDYVAQIKSASELTKSDLNGIFKDVPVIPGAEIMTTITNASCAEETSVKIRSWYSSKL